MHQCLISAMQYVCMFMYCQETIKNGSLRIIQILPTLIPINIYTYICILCERVFVLKSGNAVGEIANSELSW